MGADGSPGNVPPQILAYLREQHTLTLATAAPTGALHAATLLYVNDGLTFYGWTRPGTMTARHIEQNPGVAFTIDEYTPDWGRTRGIQASGSCETLRAPEEIERVVALFRRKYPNLGEAPADGLVYLRIAPAELYIIDNEAAAREAGQAGGERRGESQALGQAYHRNLVYSVYRSLPPPDPATASTTFETVQVPAGAAIVRQGSPADRFFIVVDGEVAVVREEQGARRQVAVLRRGQFFGEMAILRDMARTATVEALTPASLMTVEREAFRDLVAQCLGTTADFDRIIQERLRELQAMGAPTGEADGGK